MWRSVAIGVVLAGLPAACSSGGSTASSGAAVVTTASIPMRTCATGVSGALPRGWKSSALRAGSAWVYLWGAVQDNGHTGLLVAGRFAPVSPSEFHLWKTMVIAPAGRSVTLRVAPASAGRLRLAFQLPTRDPSRLTEGQMADRFLPCTSGRTYFNGGLIVAGGQCAHLTLSGATPTPVRLVAALGRSHCP